MDKKIIGITVGTPIKPSETSGSATFIPSVSSDGVLSWTNDKGLENPTPVNIKGADGKNGQDGKDGQDGNDGTPATHSWNGTTLTITSASGTSSANLKGEKGDKGDKGEQGEKGEQGIQGKDGQDYVLTEADKQEIADMVDVPDIDADLSDYAKKEYVADNYVSMELLNQIVGVLEENYATKEYVEDYINEALGGEY